MRRAKEELAALREQAEKRRSEIQADTEAVWKERHELLEDLRRLAAGLVDVSNAAAARIQRGEAVELQRESSEHDAGDEIEPRGATPPADESMEAATETTASGSRPT
jgi:hypothetical protein